MARRKTNKSTPAASTDADRALAAAWAALRAEDVPLRPAFMTELRARLLAEISQLQNGGNPLCYAKCC